MKKVGIVTSGGDCPGLNAAISGISRALFDIFSEDSICLYGIQNGFSGFSEGDYFIIQKEKLPGLSFIGGTILGTRRTPFKNITNLNADGMSKISFMKDFYRREHLDAVITLGGNGTHKTAALLSQEGMNIIALPKTIDNDIYGTDYTFGFMTAVDLAAEVIERTATHAASHGRIIFADIMGNKAGWIALYSGIAAEADMILLPEFPYSESRVVNHIKKLIDGGKKYAIICVAEGAYPETETNLKRKERDLIKKSLDVRNTAERIAMKLEAEINTETRVVSPSYYLRGGTPNSFDRIYAAQLGAYAAHLFKDGVFGVTCAMVNGKIMTNRLEDVAHRTKLVDKNTDAYIAAKNVGISFG